MPYSSDEESNSSQSENESQVNDHNSDIENSEVNESKSNNTEKKVNTTMDLWNDYIRLKDNLKDHEKEFGETEKQYLSSKKEISKEMESIVKKLNKKLAIELKPKKKRNVNPNSGFNKKVQVPEKLRKYLELDDEELLSRPTVYKILNTKLTEDGFKIKDENGTRTIIKTSKAAKTLGVAKNYEISGKQMQTFLASFYNSSKKIAN